MALKAFTRNYEDNSTEAGHQFTFYCDICNDGYKSKFIESKTYKKGSLFRNVTRGVSAGASLLGSNLGYQLERGADILSERFSGMSPEWQREHEEAFELAFNEVKPHFRRCEGCKRWVCHNDFNEEDGLCVDCAPRMKVEVTKAKAEKMVEDIKAKADQTQVFYGEIEQSNILCPDCGKPAGQGKFCANCGANLSMIKCSRCGAKSPAGTKFCGECGNKL